jgi:histidyl-tRNA synthetase
VKIERPRGTRDFLPDEMEKRRKIEGKMRKIAESFGYREIATPTFEHLQLFTLKSGEAIIEEIYAFKDKGGRDLALRPELTAPVMRMFVNECSVMPKPLRFYYFTNCFRYERPQKGRYREFWQFGVELIGSPSHLADAEVICLAYKILKELNLEFELHIGHVGLLRHLLRDLDEEKASRIMRLVDKDDVEGLGNYMDEIGLKEELKERVYSLIDLKGSREIVDEAKNIIPDFDFVYIEKVCDVLDFLDVDYHLNFGIARGLDYYTGVVFEFYAEGLGAQNQICGGGSYELAHLFGGDRTPSTGFAIGFDRVAEICDVDVEKSPKIAIVSFRGLEKDAFRIASFLREKGLVAIVDVMERSIKKQLSHANDINADFAVIVGERELSEGKVSLKNLSTQKQIMVKLEEVVDVITTSLSRKME